LLSPAHAEAIQRLATEPEIAAMMGLPERVHATSVGNYIAQHLERRAEGREYVYVLSDRKEVLGLCGLHGVGQANPAELDVCVGRPYLGKGNATFAVNRVLEFAFQNLQLERVRSRASVTSAACQHVLEKLGFQALHAEPRGDAALGLSDRREAFYEITRQQWQEARNRPALAALHPSLKPILEAELAAGNEVAELSTGWPDPDSVFVRMRKPFRTHPTPLPEDVAYNEPNDDHWWKADYGTRAPRHVLAC
jgi:hypothetical protein